MNIFRPVLAIAKLASPLVLGIGGIVLGVHLAPTLPLAILFGAIGGYVGGGTGFVLASTQPFMVGTAPTSATETAKDVIKFPLKVAAKGLDLGKSGMKYVFNAKARRDYNEKMKVFRSEKKRLSVIADGPKGQPSWDEWGKARGDLWTLKQNKPKL